MMKAFFFPDWSVLTLILSWQLSEIPPLPSLLTQEVVSDRWVRNRTEEKPGQKPAEPGAQFKCL